MFHGQVVGFFNDGVDKRKVAPTLNF